MDGFRFFGRGLKTAPARKNPGAIIVRQLAGARCGRWMGRGWLGGSTLTFWVVYTKKALPYRIISHAVYFSDEN